MDETRYYEIRIEGHISDRWSEWFEGLAIHNDPNGESVLSGAFADQAALFDTLARIQAINLILISVSRLPEKV